MTQEEQREYEEKTGSPEMEYLEYLLEHPELNEEIESEEEVIL